MNRALLLFLIAIILQAQAEKPTFIPLSLSATQLKKMVKRPTEENHTAQFAKDFIGYHGYEGIQSVDSCAGDSLKLEIHDHEHFINRLFSLFNSPDYFDDCYLSHERNSYFYKVGRKLPLFTKAISKNVYQAKRKESYREQAFALMIHSIDRSPKTVTRLWELWKKPLLHAIPAYLNVKSTKTTVLALLRTWEVLEKMPNYEAKLSSHYTKLIEAHKKEYAGIDDCYSNWRNELYELHTPEMSAIFDDPSVDISWALSFWIRRHHEGNHREILRILGEIQTYLDGQKPTAVSLIPRGWRVLTNKGTGEVFGDLNGDGKDDMARVIEEGPEAQKGNDALRRVQVFLNSDTGYTKIVDNLGAIGTVNSGGIAGDPYVKMHIKKGSLFLYLQSAYRQSWSDRLQFKMRNRELMLIGREQKTLEPTEYTTISTNYLSGKQLASDFKVINGRRQTIKETWIEGTYEAIPMSLFVE